ncbi:MAG: hypothetical protein JST81_13715 [Bacteroidetes bacterium]|nr:hypothetical protein [Bacteroidota bacterium]
MELELIRTYLPEGTNSEIRFNNSRLCFAIELPWLENRNQVSCIPEGRYELMMRYSYKFHWHLQLKNVPGRDLILIHPANDAKRELKGCIAPVSLLDGPGRGLKSRIAFENLFGIVFPVLDQNKAVFITISSVDSLQNSK